MRDLIEAGLNGPADAATRYGISAVAHDLGRLGPHQGRGPFTITDSAYGLICTETHLPLIPPAIASVMVTLSEHVFSILLILGLFTAFRRMCCWA